MSLRLVRDKIGELEWERTLRPVTNFGEHSRLLRIKIVEEATELAFAVDREQIVEEAADLLEALSTYLVMRDISMEQIVEAAEKKVNERGGFDEGTVWEY